jgi:membrane-bound lytic murein transglycosylase D
MDFSGTKKAGQPRKLMEPKIFRGILLVLFAFLINGCANTSQVTLKPEPPTGELALGEETHSAETDLTVDDPEGMCLDEELVALSETGIWDKTIPQESFQPIEAIISDFPLVYNNQVQFYLDLFQNGQRKHFSRWLARSTVYQELIEVELAEAGLPRDLLYLAMIESGFNQVALSRAKAVGLWQFMSGTAEQYQLRIDQHIDERRDALKSTRAAANYLADLYQEFGDWHLAVAAYNGGPGRIRNGMNKHQVNNFWDLAGKKYLPMETVRYVPKLIAALLIAKQPEKYGFTDIDYLAPLRYASLTVPPGLSLEAVALVSGSNVKEIKRLNQELRHNRTPPNLGEYQVKIPIETLALAEKNLNRLHATANTGYLTHTIAAGETLAQICKRYDINRTTLLKVNNLRSAKLIAGKNLRIPYNTVDYILLPEGSKGEQMIANRENLVLHRVAKGETVSAIAGRYNVPVELVGIWNGLNNRLTIRAGQQLALYLNQQVQSAEPSTVAAASRGDDDRTRLKASQQKVKKGAGQSDGYQLYSVRRGDSLWTIARRLGTSLEDIRKWNNLKSDRLAPGDTLKILKG